jgi:hypothetical protein
MIIHLTWKYEGRKVEKERNGGREKEKNKEEI